MRIIEDQDARRYYCAAVLYDFDSLGAKLAENAKLEYTNPVPVYSENRPGVPVGYATVYQVGNKVCADVAMDYATPERLNMEVGETVNAVPAGDFSMSSRFRAVDGVWLPHITLSRRREEGVGGRCEPVSS